MAGQCYIHSLWERNTRPLGCAEFRLTTLASSTTACYEAREDQQIDLLSPRIYKSSHFPISLPINVLSNFLIFANQVEKQFFIVVLTCISLSRNTFGQLFIRLKQFKKCSCPLPLVPIGYCFPWFVEAPKLLRKRTLYLRYEWQVLFFHFVVSLCSTFIVRILVMQASLLLFNHNFQSILLW